MHAVSKYCHSMCVCRVYNSSCETSLALQSGSDLCCTLDNIPLIRYQKHNILLEDKLKGINCHTCFWSSWCVCSKCGDVPPESCWFSLLCSTASFVSKWFTDSMIRWFSDSLIQWFADSLIRWLTDSLIQWFADSLIRWFNDSLIHWFND